MIIMSIIKSFFESKRMAMITSHMESIMIFSWIIIMICKMNMRYLGAVFKNYKERVTSTLVRYAFI